MIAQLNRMILLCLACAMAVSGVGLSHAADVVEVDLNAGLLTATLPFDVPFYIKGKVGESIFEVRGSYWKVSKEFNDSGPGELITRFKEAKKNKQVAEFIPWKRVKGIDAKEFYIAMPALESCSRYCIGFEVFRKLAEEEQKEICAQAIAVVDQDFRDINVEEDIDYESLRSNMTAGWTIVTDGKVIPTPGSLFDSTVTGKQLEKQLSIVTDLLTPQSLRLNIIDKLQGAEERSGLIPETSQALQDLTSSKELLAVSPVLQAVTTTGASTEALAIGVTLGDLPLGTIEEIASGYQALDPGTHKAPRPSLALTEMWNPADVAPLLANLQITFTNLRKLRSLILQPEISRQILSTVAKKNRDHLVSLLASAEESIGSVHFQIARLERALQERERILGEIHDVCARKTKTDIHVQGDTNGSFETRAKHYISIDIGLAQAPDLDELYGYVGVNIYFRPVNKEAPLRGLDFHRRFALMVGATYRSVAADGERKGILGDNGLLVGAGLRVTDHIRLSAGAMLFKAVDPNPTISDTELTSTLFLSASLDWDLLGMLGAFGDFLKK